jgi:hypothetical protein
VVQAYTLLVGEEGFEPTRDVIPADFKFQAPALRVISGPLPKPPAPLLEGQDKGLATLKAWPRKLDKGPAGTWRDLFLWANCGLIC